VALKNHEEWHVTSDEWNKIRNLYETALEKEDAERPAFLDQECANNPALRREVELLLNWQAGAEQFIESSALEIAARTLAQDNAAGYLVGRSVGHYKVLSLIGAGGMGEVYRAKDTRLNRTVAIKVLSEELATRPDQKQRLQREAKAVAALNHPHICVLHELGYHEGTDYLVMEYLGGETVAQTLRKGPLPIDQVLKYSLQIAEALDQAHRHGVVHRDLKPSNVMLTSSGVKLLDFGLAQVGVALPGFRPVSSARGEPRADEDISVSSVEAPPLTVHGTIAGTLQYMAPEQLEGKQADARTDIFAFGALLYEMVTGEKAFEGKTQISVMAAIMDHTPPPVSSVQASAYPLFDHVIQSCLEKNPDSRWQSAADILIELKMIAAVGARLRPSLSERTVTFREQFAWTVVAGLVIAAGIAAFIGLSEKRALQPSVLGFEVQTPETGFPSHIAVSPDGQRLAMVTIGDKGSALLVRRLDDPALHILPDTEGAQSPFWSPDGRYIGFLSQGKLKKVGFFGAPAETLCDAPGSLGATWSSDDVILFGSDNGPISAVSASGGAARPVTHLDNARAETGHLRPSFLPDGKHFLFVARSTRRENSAVFVGSLDSSPPKQLLASELKAVFAPPRHLLFVRDTTLMAQEFDPTRLELRGDPVLIAEDVGTNAGNGQAGFSVSDNGLLAYRAGGSITNRQLLLTDRAGNRTGLAGIPAAFQNPAFSPDGQFVAVARQDQGADIWIMTVASGQMSRFTFDPAVDDAPAWSPDGTHIIFSSTRDAGIADLYIKPSNSTGQEETILKSGHSKRPLSWSPDARFLIYEERDSDTQTDLWILPMFGDKKGTPLLRTPFNESQAQFSPDGRWIAYASDVSGRLEVYVQSFPLTGTKLQISINGGMQPHWRSDGKELFFLSLPGVEELMAVDVDAGAADSVFHKSDPRKLFQIDLLSANQRNSYDVTNSQRFLLNVIPRPTGLPPAVTVVVNWTAGL
jgi:eukaryotic-like serine/threonine-protein kinase